jgi:hypothetical protein
MKGLLFPPKLQADGCARSCANAPEDRNVLAAIKTARAVFFKIFIASVSMLGTGFSPDGAFWLPPASPTYSMWLTFVCRPH